MIRQMIIIIIFHLILIAGHEAAHWQINTYYGCEDQKIVLFKEGGIAGVESSCLFDNPNQQLLHGMNEVFGYTFIPAAVALFGLLLGIFDKMKWE